MKEEKVKNQHKTKKATRPETISRVEMLDALKRSGYLLEGRLEDAANQAAWIPETNVFYPDPENGKPRELDLDIFQSHTIGRKEQLPSIVYSEIIAECSNNSQPMVFMIKATQPPSSIFAKEIHYCGVPMKIFTNNSWVAFHEFFKLYDFHHYYSGIPYATQYCSFQKKRGNKEEWMALHPETEFESFRKLADFMDYRKRSILTSPVPISFCFIALFHPVIVLQGELKTMRQSGKGLKVSKAEHVNYRFSTFNGPEIKQYKVDIITEKFFPKFLTMVESETKKLADSCRSNFELIVSSGEKIHSQASLLSGEDLVFAKIFPERYGPGARTYPAK